MTQTNIRWWPVAVIIGLDLTVTAYVWLFEDTMRQFQVMNTLFAQVLTIFLLTLWLLFWSRLAWRRRLMITLAGLAAIAVLMGTFRIRETTGDLVPVLDWRWSEHRLSQNEAGLPGSTLPDVAERLDLSYPEFRGPSRTGVFTNVRLNPDWQANPPELLWKRAIGEGMSQFAILGERAITQEQRGDEEWVTCYILTTGDILWHHADKARFATTIGGIGPRATPTIANGRVYALGATGILNCLDLSTGKRLWSRDIIAENEAELPAWGMSGSPLHVDSLVVVCAGGGSGRSLLAYHEISGDVVWSAGEHRADYSSPFLTTLAGRQQILIFNHVLIAGHDLKTGKQLWQFPWPGETERVAQPLVLSGDKVFASSGYGVGSKFFRVLEMDGVFNTELLWESKRMKAKFANVVHLDGFIYGLDDGILACLDVKDGSRVWKRGRYGHGQLLLADTLLLILTERGELVLVEASPDGHREIAFFPALDGKTWNNPALAGDYLLFRNSQEAVAYRIPLADSQISNNAL